MVVVGYLYHVELPVTLKCSLQCKKCSFMMPYFKHSIDYDVNDLPDYMNRLFDSVDAIQIFSIVTNGTIIPDEEIVCAMKPPELTVQISDYGDYSRKKQELKDACDRMGVKCILRDSEEKI